MPEARIWPIKGVEQQSLPILVRVQHDGANITQEGINAITYTVIRHNKSTGAATTIVDGVSIDKTTTVFDMLQTAPRWKLDNTGYNFAFTVPAASFPGPDIYFVEFLFTPATGSPFVVPCEGPVESRRGAA